MFIFTNISVSIFDFEQKNVSLVNVLISMLNMLKVSIRDTRRS